MLVVYTAGRLLFTLQDACCLHCRMLVVYTAGCLLFTLQDACCLHCKQAPKLGEMLLRVVILCYCMVKS